MKREGGIAPLSRRREFHAEQFSALFSVSTAAQRKYHRLSTLIFVSSIDRYRRPMPLRRIAEQLLSPMVPLPHRFMGGFVNVREPQKFRHLPAREAPV